MGNVQVSGMIEYWIWLAETIGKASIKLPQILAHFGTPKSLFNADEREIKECGIFSDRDIARIRKRSLDNARTVLQKCKSLGCKVISYDMEEYPDRLRVITNPPCVIYTLGNLPHIDGEVAITIVGPRKASRNGIKSAASLSARLSVTGCVIVGGAARGVDSAVLEGCLAAGGKPVCVVPCGIDVDYPTDTLKVRKEIVRSGGCVISECPPGEGYVKGAFNARNRLLAALSLATVVIEAGDQSGALITADCAAAQGKDVFAIPGPIESPEFVGSNRLIRDGARALLATEDILLEYASAYPHKLNLILSREPFAHEILAKLKAIIGAPAEEKPTVQVNAVKAQVQPIEFTLPKIDRSTLSEVAAKVYDGFCERVMSPDRLADITELPAGDVLSALVELEIFGYISSLPGGRFEIVDQQ